MNRANPELTVVVPAHGRPAALAACLRALATQTLAPERYEVVVVDDGSPEPLLAHPLEAKAPGGSERPRAVEAERLDLRVVRQDNRGPAAARNRGASAARGRWLAFTDDDCAPAPDWAQLLVETLERSPGALVGGRTVNALPANPFAEASQLLVDHLYDERQRGADPTPFFTSNNLALASESFAGLGGFDPAFRRAAGEDRDLCDRAIERGHLLIYEPRARVDHAHSMGLAGFWRQHFGYGRGGRVFHRRRAERGRRFPQPRPSFYLGLLAHPWRRSESGRSIPDRVGLTALLALSQVANALGFFRQALR